MIWKTLSETGWGRTLSAPARVARPERVSALAGLIGDGDGPLAPRGAGRAYGDAALSGGGRVVTTTRLDRLLSFDAETGLLEAEAGVTLADLLATFAPRGWMPAVLPGTGAVTLGGAIAADIHGKNHPEAGSFGAHVESLELLGADGKVRRISPQREKARFRATIGGMGLTGLIVTARLRLVPCPSVTAETESRRVPDLDAMMEAIETSPYPFRAGWIDTTARGRHLGRGLIEETRFGDPLAAPEIRAPRRIDIPVEAPGWLLNRASVRAFNRLRYHRVPEEGRMRPRLLADALFPLDRLGHWNRLYGPRGFHQMQCVIAPDSAPAVLDRMLVDIATAGIAAPLAVLKRLGPGGAGMLSFATEGWTLAVDIANRPRAGALVARLHELTREAGGRIYLAKDSLAPAAAMEEMYPELPAFRALLAETDPDGVFGTDLGRRLGLRP